MSKTSPKKPEGFTGIAWSVKPVADGCWAGFQLSIKDGTVVATTPIGEPNLKAIVGQNVGDELMEFMVGGRLA